MPCRRRFVKERRHWLDDLFASLPAWARDGLHRGRLCFVAGGVVITRNQHYPKDPPAGCVGKREYIEWLAEQNGAG
jgi:hypothetical protein